MYKHARAYRLSESPIYALTNLVALNDAANEFAFVAPQGQEAIRFGFVPPYPHVSANLIYAASNCLFFAIKTQWKDIPASALNDEMQPLLKAKVEATGRDLTKLEKTEIKEQVLQNLIPRALAKSKVLQGYIDIEQSLIVFNSSSANDAETAMGLMRKAFESLPALPWLDAHKLSMLLNLWCKEQGLPQGILRGHNGSFKAPDSCGAVSSFKNHVFDERVTQHLDDKLCTQLEMYWPERFSFTINDSGTLCKLKWNNTYTASNDEMGYDDLPARTDADLLLMLSALRPVFSSFQQCVAQAAVSSEENNPLTDDMLLSAKIYLMHAGTVTLDQLASKFDLSQDHAKALVTALLLKQVATATYTSSGQFVYEYNDKQPPAEDDADPLIKHAKDFVISTRRASVSALQRHLRIGYNYASRIMEALESAGVVSMPGHNGQREVLVPASEVAE